MTILGLMPISLELLPMGIMRPSLDGFVTYDMKLLTWGKLYTSQINLSATSDHHGTYQYHRPFFQDCPF